jgi:hypothetical protein
MIKLMKIKESYNNLIIIQQTLIWRALLINRYYNLKDILKNLNYKLINFLLNKKLFQKI